MSAQHRFSLVQVLGTLTLPVGAIVIVIACLAIAGWVFDFGGFRSMNQSYLGITPDAALCFIFCWVSLWVLRESTEKVSENALGEASARAERAEEGETEIGRGVAEKKWSVVGLPRRLAQLLAAMAVVISVLALAGRILGLDAWAAGVSGWASQVGTVLGDMSAQGGLSARMAPSAAFAFLLNGVALTTLDVETRGGSRPAQHLGLVALFLSLLVAIGHAYQTSPLEHFIVARGWPEMTALMAIIFIALSVGVVCARPRNGMIALLSSESAAGHIARTLAPAAIVIPALFGVAAVYGVRAGYFGASYGTLVVTAASAIFFAGLAWRAAMRLRDLDAKRALAETELYKAYSDLQKRVSEQAAELMRANQDLWAEMVERERAAEERREELTERRRIESRLRESEARFRLMIDSAPAMIWISDADKVCYFFNRGWLDYTGRTDAFIVQSAENGWAEDIHPEDVGRCLEIYNEAFDNRRQCAMEYRLRRQDGQYRWVLNHAAPLFNFEGADGVDETERAEGMFAGYMGYCVDVHERKERERLIENERDEILSREQLLRGEAEDVSRMKDEFLATVTHELRSPLNAIQGWVKLLRDGRLSAEETARALETIERGARAQNRIISDLLDVSRIITGKLRLHARPVQPAAAIEAAVESLREAAQAKNISIELVLDNQAGPVAGDSDRLRQIVWNLVSNAIKFTPERGQIQVRLERKEECVEITVEDTGVGIAPDFLPFVFDRFRQGDGSSARRHGGLGLGLAIVRYLTEMHGGGVSVHSDGPDRGASFVVRLPLLAQAADEADGTDGTDKTDEADAIHTSYESYESYESYKSYAPYESPDIIDQALELDGLRVLAVDNDSDARDLIKTILTQYGAVVETAGSVGQALAVFERPEEWRPELLISDIEMPEADGYQLIRKLREMEARQGKRVPAIALTAYAGAEDRLRSLSAGFHMHVTKPVEPVELLTIVASLTGRLNRPRSIYETDDIAEKIAGDMAGQEAM